MATSSERIGLLLFTLGECRFALDISEIHSLNEFEELHQFRENIGIFRNFVSHLNENLLLIDLNEHYQIDSPQPKPHYAVVEMDQLFAAIKDRKVIDRINGMFQFFDKEENGISRSRFAFLINAPDDITQFTVDDLRPLPDLIAAARKCREFWGAVMWHGGLYSLIDLKKLLIAKIQEVF